MSRPLLISSAYLELLQRAMRPGEILDATDFPRWLNDIKFRLKGEGRQELFDQIVREEIHMIETRNDFV